MTKVQKEKVITQILSFIPKNKRGFPSKFDPKLILQCIIHKLKTGCQWACIFVDLQGVTYPFSWQTVYYFFNKWSKLNIFEEAFNQLKIAFKGNFDLANLNLDGTQSFAKKGVKK